MSGLSATRRCHDGDVMAAFDQLMRQIGEMLRRCHMIRMEALVEQKGFHGFNYVTALRFSSLRYT